MKWPMKWPRKRRGPKWSHPCQVCNRMGREAPHDGQHAVRNAPPLPVAVIDIPPPAPRRLRNDA